MADALSAESHYRPGYPIFLDLHGKHVVVIGGGEVAQRKIETLLDYGACVRVVASEASSRVRGLASAGCIELVERPYQEGDLSGAFIAFCACGDPKAEEEICTEAEKRGCPLNVVDVPTRCDFIVPSIVARGPLQIAVSTSGAAPTEAKKIRRALEQDFDESWKAYLELMGQVRLLVKERIEGAEPDRRPVYEAACSAGWRERLAAGEQIDAEAAYAEACEKAGMP